MNELVILDLDNTLIKGQSQQFLLKYLFSKKLINLFPFLKISCWFLAYKLKLTKNPKPIMNYAFRFLENWKVEDFEKLINQFFQEILKKRIFRETEVIINKHKEKNRDLLIISNAIVPIVEKLSSYLKVAKYLGTQLEIKNGLYTGKIIGNIVYGNNKVSLIKKYCQQNNLSLKNCWAYGDHASDIPILELATFACAVNPDTKLYQEAQKRGWKIFYFKKLLNR
jgi:HAD superfamily hydrolase (TIGR01490 family)